MCSTTVIEFGKANILPSEVTGKVIIEVGSRDVNGSLRSDLENFKPLKYLGVDMMEGKGVDDICDVTQLVARYGKNNYDLVVSTELMEHVREWRTAISNLKNIIKPDGVILLTTRSKGFNYHGFPYDFWRYEIEDIKQIFSDFIIEKLESDTYAPGILLKARKPSEFKEKALDPIQLYSIIRNKKCTNVNGVHVLYFNMKWSVYIFFKRIIPKPVKKMLLTAFYKGGK
jgi:SAM-dependent methyltransferase